MQELDEHVVKECMFGKGDESSKGKKIKKNEKIVWHETLDEEVMDKINEHTTKGSLEARILLKTESLKESLSNREVKLTTSDVNNTEPKPKKSNRKPAKGNKAPEPKEK